VVIRQYKEGGGVVVRFDPISFLDSHGDLDAFPQVFIGMLYVDAPFERFENAWGCIGQRRRQPASESQAEEYFFIHAMDLAGDKQLVKWILRAPDRHLPLAKSLLFIGVFLIAV